SQGLQRSSGCGAESQAVLHVLQWATSASSVELSNTGSCVLRREPTTDRHAPGRLHCRSSFIGLPDAKISQSGRKGRKDAASRRFHLMSFEGMRKSIRTIE